MQEMKHKRIVLVESDPGMALAITRALSEAGNRCETVDCADALSRAVGESAPDLILIDADGKGVDPRQICLSLRRDQRNAAVKIMVLNASGRRIERRRCEALGADGMLAKPFGLAELRAEARRLLGDAPVAPV